MWLGELTVSDMTIAVDLGCKATNQTNKNHGLAQTPCKERVNTNFVYIFFLCHMYLLSVISHFSCILAHIFCMSRNYQKEFTVIVSNLP